MSISRHEWEVEQSRVNEVVKAIEMKMDHLKQHLSSLKKDVVEIRKDFWEDVKVNLDSSDDIIETFTSIKQQSEFLSERERSHGHTNYQLIRLQKLKNTPYFGRIDISFHDEEEPQSIYLGTSTFLNEQDEFLVYDWRAPISSLYYDSLPGPVHYHTHAGNVEGEMLLKRQYIIKNSTLRSMFDTGLTIGDELLQEVLSQHSDTQMKTIVATIQKEQNDIIRQEGAHLLIVQGAAGSGKTSAALQRVAYLLYRYRETLQAEQIVLFSPNRMFNSYVSTVLPELGEKNMQQTTFQDFLVNRLEEGYKFEDVFSQLEYALSGADNKEYQVRMDAIHFKTSTDYRHVLDSYIDGLKNKGMIFIHLTFRGKVLISAEEMTKLFYEMDDHISIPNRIQILKEQLVKRLKKLAKLEMNKKWVEDEIQYLDKETYLKAFQKLKKTNSKLKQEEAFDDLSKEQYYLSKMVVKKKFGPIFQKVNNHEFFSSIQQYKQLFARKQEDMNLPSNWVEIGERTINSIDKGLIPYEDQTPLLYLKQRIEGNLANTSVKHIFIDEAQDYSPLQLYLIKLLFPNCHMTLLGDLNQAIYTHSINGLDFTTIQEEEGTLTKRMTLSKSYRSTKQIIEFTREILESAKEIQAFNRSGAKPVVNAVPSSKLLHEKVMKQIEEFQESGTKNIAVICKTAGESKELYEELSKEITCRLVKKETNTFEDGVVIIPAYLAKGVEFDAVIIFNASKDIYYRESERKLFYTACTRAMHELIINYTGERTPFLRNVSPNLYEENPAIM